jgi:hypothetical protein
MVEPIMRFASISLMNTQQRPLNLIPLATF